MAKVTLHATIFGEDGIKDSTDSGREKSGNAGH